MFDKRLIIEAKLKLLSPLHIGTGEQADRYDVTRRDEDGDPVPVAVSGIVRDCYGRAYVPSTTVKGILRALLKEDVTHKGLYGRIKSTDNNGADDDATGAIGRLTAYGMRLIEPFPNAGALPYAGGKSGPGIYVSSHTSINPLTGTAEKHKLFHEERLAAGAQFKLRLIYTHRGDENAKILERLWKTLACFNRADGVAFGAGQADANGRMKLDSEFTIRREFLNDSGEIKSEPFDLPKELLEPPAKSGTAFSMLLECPDPFLIVDSSHDPKQHEKTDPRRTQVKAARLAKDLPMINSESIMGAIKARADWMLRLEVINDKAEDKARQAIMADLFGSTEQRGLLMLESMDVPNSAKLKDITSVALDRFSGAPIDQALFKTEAFIGTKLSISLQLGERKKVHAVTPSFAQKLIDDIEKNGLDLGHGWAKGFGWFRVKERV